jgi:hypothetical protein
MKTNKKYKNKLVGNELTITEADKGKIIVILRTENYVQKVNNFLQENKFILLNNNPMKSTKKL